MPTRVIVTGATGRFGSLICDVVDGLDGFEVVARLDSTASAATVAELSADLLVDATNIDVSVSLVSAALAAGMNVVVATSGWNEERTGKLGEEVAAMNAADGGKRAVAVIPNFSVGSVLASQFAAAAAPHFSRVEIVETHHESKVDAPSGTAVRTAEMIAAARQVSDAGPVDDHSEQARGLNVSGVAVHSLRLPSVSARQEVHLSGPGESLVITHEVTDRSAYAPGIRRVVEAVASRPGVTVGLEQFLVSP